MASLLPKTGVMGENLAAHLLRRLTFGPTKPEILDFAGKTFSEAVDQLLQIPPVPSPPLDPQTGSTWVVNGADDAVNSPEWRLVNYVIAWWMQEAFEVAQPSAVQKLTFFLHTTFTTDFINLHSEDDYYLLLLFRQYATGSFKTLAKKVSVDNSMMEYLDTRWSSRWSPNENYARELLELFTIGKGDQIGPDNYTTYTEADIVAAAKILTGFRQNQNWADPAGHDPDTGLPTATVDTNAHDPNDKIFTDAFASPAFPGPVTITGRNTQSGMFDELSDLIEMIFAQDATAENICRKIYRYFVNYDITAEVESDIILPLASILKANSYDLYSVYTVLFQSEHFYDEALADPALAIIGSRIKSPLDFYIGAMRFFQVNLPDPTDPDTFYRLWHRDTIQNFLLAEAGMPAFNPPNVAGYPAFHQEPTFHRLWISANTLPFRYTFAEMLFSGKKVTKWGSLYMNLDVVALVTDIAIVPEVTGPDPFDGTVGTYAGGRFADHLVQSLLDYAFPQSPDPVRFSYFLDDLLLGNLSPINWRFEWVAFETTGDDTNIRPQLEALIKGIIQAPEFHLG